LFLHDGAAHALVQIWCKIGCKWVQVSESGANWVQIWVQMLHLGADAKLAPGGSLHLAPTFGLAPWPRVQVHCTLHLHQFPYTVSK
jgi:hypothetical protein